jgi:Kef-type K+ transport system membrane component KefB
MSQVQLQVRPRRVRCATTSEPPPFRFDAGQRRRERATGAALAVQAPFRAIWLLLRTVGQLIDAAFFLACITIWCALHITVWSYAFEMGPAADCFTLPCPEWLRTKVLVAAVALAVVSFLIARILRRLGHRMTSFMLLVLVTFDVAALILLAMSTLAAG